MLNIKEKECVNSVNITGILSELTVEVKDTKDKKQKLVTCEAKIKVDQDVNGKIVENEIPVQYISKQYKKGTEDTTKTPNQIFDKICKFPEQFHSLASLPDDRKDEASRVTVSNGKLQETVFLDEQTKKEKTGFRVTSNFLNAAKQTDKAEAKFELSGVVMGKAREIDSNNEETGRLKVKLAVVGYQGRVDTYTLIAESPSCVDHIDINWQEGDTVNVYGAINFKQSTKTWQEDLGFGEPITRTKTETRKELIILGGSPNGLEEALAYDNNDIKAGLADRRKRIEEQAEKRNAPTASAPTSSFGDFNGGF